MSTVDTAAIRAQADAARDESTDWRLDDALDQVAVLCDEVETLRAALADVREWVGYQRNKIDPDWPDLLAILDRAGVTP